MNVNTFDFEPKLVVIYGYGSHDQTDYTYAASFVTAIGIKDGKIHYRSGRDQPGLGYSGQISLQTTWNGTQVSYYGDQPMGQLNYSNQYVDADYQVYYYVGIG